MNDRHELTEHTHYTPITHTPISTVTYPPEAADWFTLDYAVEQMNKAEIDILVGNRCVVAKIAFGDWGDLEFRGDSRCHPNDKFEESIGVALALSRAFARASKVLQTRAERLIDN